MGEWECGLTRSSVAEDCGWEAEEWTGEGGDPCVPQLGLQYLTGRLRLDEVSGKLEREAIMAAAEQIGKRGRAERAGGDPDEGMWANMTDEQAAALEARLRERKLAKRGAVKLIPRYEAYEEQLYEESSALGKRIDAVAQVIAGLKAGRVPAGLPRIPVRRRKTAGEAKPKGAYTPERLAALQERAAKARAAKAGKKAERERK